ncbi:MAG: hypothetical protein HXY50_10950 [Ignavibacteriaceae bacterium]|nr:hypothetical protein [Ignavibacteriaceae bacterium]
MNNLSTLRNFFFVFVSSLGIGCLNYIQDVNLYADGSGVMRISYWMKSSGNENSVIAEKIGLFNEDSLKSAFSSPYNTIEEIEVYADSTDSTMHSLIELTFNNIDSLNNHKSFKEYKFSLRDGATGQKVFSQFIPPIATGFGVNRSDFKIQYKYTFGGEIITHNAQEKEGRTLIWNYTLSDIGSGKTILVTFKPFKLKETPYWIYVLSGIVLLIVVIFLFRKKKD